MGPTQIERNGLTPLEIASHVLIGRDDGPAPAAPSPAGSARAALELSVLEALNRAPCFVGFSGGRDSSAILAVATHVARREGLPDPIPSTLRFAGAPQTQEADWQDLVLRHLNLTDRICHEFTDELDLVGPAARTVMAHEGLPYPYNLHLLAPLIEQARGGSFVSGLGGDQALDGGGPVLDILAGRTRPTARDVLRVGAELSPRPLRRRLFRGRVGLAFPWLRPEANRILAAGWLEQYLRQPVRWDRLMRELARSRFMRLTLRRIAALGARADAAVHHPFAEPGFVLALGRDAGATGFASRTAAFHELFADVLPDELIGRSTKAAFDEVLWSDHTRSFVSGLDEDVLETTLAALGLDALVDAPVLLELWRGEAPPANSFLLLQACWLAMR